MSSNVAGDLGYVLRPTLAGHRIWPAAVAPSPPRSRAQVEGTANGAYARTPNRQPRHPGGRARRGMPPEVETGRRWCPRAQVRFAVSSTRAGRNGVDAAADRSLRRCPASVDRRTGAPPSPCSHDGSRQPDDRPPDHRPPDHRPSDHRPPEHRQTDHRQIATVRWHTAISMQSNANRFSASRAAGPRTTPWGRAPRANTVSARSLWHRAFPRRATASAGWRASRAPAPRRRLGPWR